MLHLWCTWRTISIGGEHVDGSLIELGVNGFAATLFSSIAHEDKGRLDYKNCPIMSDKLVDLEAGTWSWRKNDTFESPFRGFPDTEELYTGRMVASPKNG